MATARASVLAQPPPWVSLWFALSTAVVIWDACYCFYRPRSLVGGDLAWIWAPYNMVPYGLVDYLYGQHALDSGDGFTNAQALLNIVECAGNAAFLALQHAAVFRRYRPVAPLVGFAAALMTTSKTVLYFLQEYFCGWCMVGHNDRKTFWLVWVLPNGTWIVVPLIVTLVLGVQLARTLVDAAPSEAAEARHSKPSAIGAVVRASTDKATPSLGNELAADDWHGVALPLTFHPRNLAVLVVGSNRLAASRAATFVEAGATVVVATRTPASELFDDLRARVAAGDVALVSEPAGDGGDDTAAWARLIEAHDAALVCVADTLIGAPAAAQRTPSSAAAIARAARAARVPINVADQPALSTYTFPAVHRFAGARGAPGSLQVAVSTDGKGCRLAARIRRDIVARLPASVGAAVDNVGQLRERAKAGAGARAGPSRGAPARAAPAIQELSEDDVVTPLNSPVPQLAPARGATPVSFPFGSGDGRAGEARNAGAADDGEQQLRRMRWVHQMSEYYSYDHLARLSPAEMDAALETWDGEGANAGTSGTSAVSSLPHHGGALSAAAPGAGAAARGRILLVGSGPGAPGLLTVAALHALRTATVVLSDKLVPAEILALVPPTAALHIARKFPGNAEGAQSEMMERALVAARAGDVVVRLKQGDPFVYGRGGEEVLFFRRHGFECAVVPGVSSALAGPLMAGIPVTQRGVAESVVVCTGVGRGGKAVRLPGYARSRSLVILMGVARIAAVVDVLTSARAGAAGGVDDDDDAAGARDGAAYPPHLPIAVIERGSSADQRAVLSTLRDVAAALASLDAQRPPAMLLVGWAAMCLDGPGRVDVLDTPASDGPEEALVQGWLGGERWMVREGLGEEWKALMRDVDV